MDAFDGPLSDIPQFLRRPADPSAKAPPLPAEGARPAPAPRLPHGLPIHQGRAPVTPPFAARQPAPADGPETPDTAVQVPGHADLKIVTLAARDGGASPAPLPAPAGPDPAAMHAELEAAAADWPQAEDQSDVAFQVTLPRSVIRQIRLCAAAEGTTHRAIILRALRTAGLAIPEGADVDRRALAARRRQQA